MRLTTLASSSYALLKTWDKLQRGLNFIKWSSNERLEFADLLLCTTSLSWLALPIQFSQQYRLLIIMWHNKHTNKQPAVSGTPTFFEQMASKSSVPYWSPPPLSASLNILPILHLPTYITARAPLPPSTHLHLPFFLFLRHFHFLCLCFYLFLFTSPRFFFLYTTFPSIICFCSSSVFLTLVSYPLIAKFLHLPLSPSPLYPHFLLSTYLCNCRFRL